ncbi:MAG: glycosyltransferase family 2 protein [Bacteroidales bacterium]|nr:glycosyltransferase family 2 protein [Bacteroidales bacterium]
MRPKITIILPVRNGSNYLREALQSLRRQDMDPEIIVVNDGSTDDTAAIAESFGCKVISHPVSKGQVAAKNTGIAAATGSCIMFMDHDDVMREGTLKALYNALETSPDVSAVEAKVKDFLSPELGELPGTVIRPDAYYGLFTGAILTRKEVFDKIGPFSESLHTGEIIEWQTRMNSKGMKIKKLDFIATDRRLHRTNFGKTDGKVEFKNYASVLRERLKMRGK